MRQVTSEAELCLQFAHWLKYQHPDVADLAHFDYGSGLKMTMGQARRQKALNRRSWPDFMLACPMNYEGIHYNGLFLEFKREGTRIHKKDGSWASDHIQEQAEQLGKLKDAGYIATFVVGFDEAVEVTNSYLGVRS